MFSWFSQHSRLLATSHGFCQKTRFWTGAALLISIIIDCNYLTSPYIPRGTWKEMCFAKCSFYLCKILKACSGVLLILVKPLEASSACASMSSVSSGAEIKNFTYCCGRIRRVLYLKPLSELKLDFKLCKGRTRGHFPSPLILASCMGPGHLEGIQFWLLETLDLMEMLQLGANCHMEII